MRRVVLAMLLVAVAGCPGGVVNNATPDATPIPPDANLGPNGLGQACGTALPACPDGWECLDQDGGNAPFCTHGCTGQMDPICNSGYAGPGFGACILTPVGRTDLVCAVVCQDSAGPPEICPAGTTCNGTCLGDLTCTGEITDTNLNIVGYSCQ